MLFVFDRHTFCHKAYRFNFLVAQLFIQILFFVTFSQPPTREVCDQLFEAADRNKSGGIDQDEFVKIMGVCCAQILSRMLIYYLVLILFVPYLAAYAADGMNIENGSYQEMATEQIISTALFFAAIPLLWDQIDTTSAKTLAWQKKEWLVGVINDDENEEELVGIKNHSNSLIVVWPVRSADEKNLD